MILLSNENVIRFGANSSECLYEFCDSSQTFRLIFPFQRGKNEAHATLLLLIGSQYANETLIWNTQYPFHQKSKLSPTFATLSGKLLKKIWFCDFFSKSNFYSKIWKFKQKKRKLFPWRLELYARCVKQEKMVAVFDGCQGTDWINNVIRRLFYYWGNTLGIFNWTESEKRPWKLMGLGLKPDKSEKMRGFKKINCWKEVRILSKHGNIVSSSLNSFF